MMSEHAQRKLPVWMYHLSRLILIPLYFLLHNFFLYREEVDFSSLLPYIAGWFLLPLITYALFRFRFREKKRTAWLFAMFFLIFYFTFGPIYSFLSSLPYLRIFTKVSVILTLITGVALLVVFFHHRINLEKNRLPKFVFTLIFFLILFDGINFFFLGNRFTGNQYDLKEKDPMAAMQTSLIRKPDIFYIFFDELMQTDALRQYTGYDNSSLDSALIKRGFFVASKSKSAYYATPFSIASAFQSSVFLEKKKKNIHLLDYLVAYKEIQQNPIIPYLRNQGYSIRNFAHYKLFKEESQSMFKDSSYDTRQIVLNQTFSSLMYQLTYGVLTDKLPVFMRHSDEEKAQIELAQRTVAKKYEEISQASLIKSRDPLFVHGHFFVPHLPVLFDSLGKALTYEEVKLYQSDSQLIQGYKMNLAYSRKLITHLVDDIMKNTHNQAVIIIQSDHGFRGNKNKPVPSKYKFSNFTAILFPDGDYSKLENDFYLPNTFRYVLNKYSADTIRLTAPEFVELSSEFLDD